MSLKYPVVALVGPPNVGKSTLFNTMAGKRIAVTGPTPGTTRDRAYAEVQWGKKKMMLVDTAGLAAKGSDPLEKSIRFQTQIALLEADLILFLVDGQEPIAAATQTVKQLRATLREHKKTAVPIILVANKVDSPKEIPHAQNTYQRLGLGPVFALSAVTGRGVGDLLDEINEKIAETAEKEPENIFATVALVGRPNVGKSTLTNFLAGEERVVVSDLPGTTRASVDIQVNLGDKKILFIDTAGMRRRSKIDIDIEQYSLFQAIKSIERADVVVLLLDATAGPARFEQTIAGRLKESTKGVVLAINKKDLLESNLEIKEVETSVRMLYPFLKFAKLILISSKTGEGVKKLIDAIIEAKNSRDLKIAEDDLKASLKDWMHKNSPKKLRDQKMPKIFALKQAHANPPTFHLIVNEPHAIHYSYIRYIENQIRKKYGFVGTAMRIRARKPKT